MFTGITNAEMREFEEFLESEAADALMADPDVIAFFKALRDEVVDSYYPPLVLEEDVEEEYPEVA
jgi:hypothetical protein